MSNLPELPPALHAMEWQHDMYTAAQMLQFQADTLEACAKEFDKLYLVSGQEVGPAIRSLLK